MPFESLPNELLLHIFSYLHKFDILYTFTNLNERFQQIINPYSYDIDLTDEKRPSYRLWQLFCEEFLPLFGRNIRSLKLVGKQQLQLFQSHIHWLTNLESLVIEEDEGHDVHQFPTEKQFLTEVLSISSLSEFSIFPAKQSSLRTIASYALHHLTALTLIFDCDIPNFAGIPQMLSVKRLYINLWSVKSIIQLFKKIPNIEQLNLSILRFKNFKSFHLIKVPQTLERLHLEIGGFHYAQYRPTFEFIEQFVNVFKNQIQLLSLIFIDALEQFSDYDKLQSLVKNFSRLEKFEYYIHTIHQSDSFSIFPNVKQLQDLTYILYTLPQLQQFDTISSRTSVDYSFDFGCHPTYIFNYRLYYVSNVFYHDTVPTTFEFKTDLRLTNMQQIGLHLSDNLSADMQRFLSKVIVHSSNLTAMTIDTTNGDNFLKQMSSTIPVNKKKQIIYFELVLRDRVINSRFFLELSAILPHLKILKFHFISKDFNYSFISLTDIVPRLRKYFRKLNILIIELRIHDDNTRKAFKNYKRQLYELTKRTTNHQSLYYIANVTNYKKASLSIWL